MQRVDVKIAHQPIIFIFAQWVESLDYLLLVESDFETRFPSFFFYP